MILREGHSVSDTPLSLSELGRIRCTVLDEKKVRQSIPPSRVSAAVYERCAIGVGDDAINEGNAYALCNSLVSSLQERTND